MVLWSTRVLCSLVTCGLCSPGPFYYIYFQVEQPQLPNNDIKSAGITAQGESMLTRVIIETTCRGSNSFQISRWCSWCTDINLVTSFRGCGPVVVSRRSIHTCMVRGLLLFGHFLLSARNILKASLIPTVNPFLASKPKNSPLSSSLATDLWCRTDIVLLWIYFIIYLSKDTWLF